MKYSDVNGEMRLPTWTFCLLNLYPFERGPPLRIPICFTNLCLKKSVFCTINEKLILLSVSYIICYNCNITICLCVTHIGYINILVSINCFPISCLGLTKQVYILYISPNTYTRHKLHKLERTKHSPQLTSRGGSIVHN